VDEKKSMERGGWREMNEDIWLERKDMDEEKYIERV
jgi:hypothetical protein